LAGGWLCDDIPLNSLKRLPYFISTSGFDFGHITAVDMHQSENFIEIGPPSAEKNDVNVDVDFQDGGSQPSWILGVQ